jgi:hypothetical protein
MTVFNLYMALKGYAASKEMQVNKTPHLVTVSHVRRICKPPWCYSWYQKARNHIVMADETTPGR